MKLSQNTLAVLKNFSSINNGIVIKEGNKLNTMSVMRNIVASAEVEETFPECAFYNLSELLSVISLFKDADLEFADKFVTIGTGRSKVRYFYSDPTVIVAPTKEIKAPAMEISFSIGQDSLNELIKAASVLGLPDIVVESSGDGEMKISACDIKNPSTNVFSRDLESIGDGGDLTFKMVFKADSITKLRGGSYDVSISSKNISHWKALDHNSEYYLSLESTSKFG